MERDNNISIDTTEKTKKRKNIFQKIWDFFFCDHDWELKSEHEHSEKQYHYRVEKYLCSHCLRTKTVTFKKPCECEWKTIGTQRWTQTSFDLGLNIGTKREFKTDFYTETLACPKCKAQREETHRIPGSRRCSLEWG